MIIPYIVDKVYSRIPYMIIPYMVYLEGRGT